MSIYCFSFPPSQQAGFCGIVLGRKGRLQCDPAGDQAATDNKQIGRYRPQNLRPIGDEAVIGVGRVSEIAAEKKASEEKQNKRRRKKKNGSHNVEMFV